MDRIDLYIRTSTCPRIKSGRKSDRRSRDEFPRGNNPIEIQLRWLRKKRRKCAAGCESLTENA